MKTSQKGIDLIKAHSLPSLKAYIDALGVTKIGYNHTTDLAVGTRITEQEATDLLRDYLGGVEQFISRLIRRKLSQHQFDALVSFVFSMREEDFLKSTLLKRTKINPNDSSIAAEFNKWIHRRGRANNDLINQRAAEVELYFTKQEDEEL